MYKSCLYFQGCCVVSSVVGMSGLAQPLLAQVVPDGTLGAEFSSQVETTVFKGKEAVPDGTAGVRIKGGHQQGPNLFHSFSEFGVEANKAVYFANPASVANIFSRVTGSKVSEIDGMLGVEGPASLFLLNPNGIVFGPKARLDISGSFTATTAEDFKFSDGQIFSAVKPQAAPLLKLGVTPGLQLGKLEYGSQSEPITTEPGAELHVGQNLTLVADKLNFSGSLESGRDLILQGELNSSDKTSYAVGGYLFTKNQKDEVIDFVNPHEKSILAENDLTIESDYRGESLHILAGGSVDLSSKPGQGISLSNINIVNQPKSSVVSTPKSQKPEDSIIDSSGKEHQITVKPIEQPIVDIRSGVNWIKKSNFSGNSNKVVNSNKTDHLVEFSNKGGIEADSKSGIRVGSITNPGGQIYLSSRGKNNESKITTGHLDGSIPKLQKYGKVGFRDRANH